jgi:solute:Na+ symporter, SSS family
MIGTTGQGATDGLRFIQFYFGLPLAMIVLGVTIVPLLRGARVFTAYEFLERRFNAPTRALTSFLFLCSRGMSCGAIIAAPAVVFSAIFGWDLPAAVALIGVPTILYTMVGGVQAVTWADVKQMVLIVFSLCLIVIVLLVRLPVPPDDALRIAGTVGRLRTFDFSFNLTETYTFWSGALGGFFLMLSYFGTDQSQAQRYLTARSDDAARTSLLMSAYWKIPLQALVLIIGVLVFVFYIFQQPPLLFNPAHESAVRNQAGGEYALLEAEFSDAWRERQHAARAIAERPSAETPQPALQAPAAAVAQPGDAAAAQVGTAAAAAGDPADRFRAAEARVGDVRSRALDLAQQVTGQTPRDVNYIIPHFVLTFLPLGLAGLFIAAVMAAAMSSISSELNSLSTATVIDFYRRWVSPHGTDSHLLFVSRIATVIWGLVACFVATYAVRLGSLIEVVNRFGSFFYGSILGVFLLAMIRFAKPWAAFAGLIAGMSTVAAVTFLAPSISFLWHNVIGAGTVVLVGILLSTIPAGRRAPA